MIPHSGGTPTRRTYDLNRVLAALPVIAALPVTVFAAVLMYMLWSNQQYQARREIQHSVQTLAVALDREMTSQIRRAALLADDPSLAAGALSMFHEKAQRLLAITPEWANVQLDERGGAEVLNLGGPVDAPPPAGLPAVSRAVFETGKAAVSDLYETAATKTPGVSIAVPVVRDGQVVYVLVVRLDLTWLAKILVELYQDNGAAAVLDRDMRVIARNRGMPNVVGRLATPDARAMMIAAPRGVQPAHNLDAVDVYNAWQRTQFGWTVAVGRPADVFDAPLRKSLWLLAVAGLVLLGAGIEIARRLSRVITTEITQSAADALLLSEGRAMPVRESPIKQLARLRDMLHLTSQRLQKLLVAERSANAAKDQFLAMLGHELRNPLSPIVTALQLMKLKGTHSPEQDIIQRQVTNLTRLVDDLLDVARIARGNIELHKQAVEIAEPVARAVEIARPLIEQRHHRLAVDVQTSGMAVEVDMHRMAQVISNLLTNAAKYSDPGSSITLVATRDGDLVRISVKDEGIGIAPDMLNTIFESFVQQPQTLDRARGGLGLGLAIVRNLVVLHGGTVDAHSAGPGRGSEFVIALPATAMPRSTTGEAPGTEAARIAPIEHPVDVLVVDDNQDAARMHESLLQALGCNVATAPDGEAALHVVQSFKPQIALLDIGLPGMSGYELAQRLRELLGAQLRLVALTGYGQDSDRLRSRGFGFHWHLTKPVDIHMLRRVIVELTPKMGTRGT